MIRSDASGLPVVRLLLLMGLGGPVSLLSQDPRDSLVARAFSEFDAARRVPLLVTALDPGLGPPRGAWSAGVQLLAQTLIEEGQESAAAVWLRWAIRRSAEFQPDTVQFLPQVLAAYRAAQEFVGRTRTPGDTATVTSWLWPAQGIAETNGRIQAATAPLAVPVQVLVKGLGQLLPGASASVAPGSYEIRASAAGYDSVRVTREVLPGVTTVLELHLRAELAQLAPTQSAQLPLKPVAAPRRGKRFPWVLAVLGAAGAGTGVAILAGRKSNPPTTGGITINIPNP
jgi:hypothetical protein